MDALTVTTSLGGAVLSGGGMAAILAALAKRRTAPADITSRLSAAAMAQVDQMQEQAKHAELQAQRAEMRMESALESADQLRKQVRLMEDTMDRLAKKLQRLTDAIHEPHMTLERLRAMIPVQSGQNGVQP